MQSLALLLVLAPALALASKPSFCKTYECPNFISQRLAEDTEQRQYEASNWASTSNAEANQRRGMFMKLYRYIQGANSRNVNIPMTVPVLTKMESSSTSLLFYMPASSPPRPRDADVTLVRMPVSDFYVRTFVSYVWTSQSDYNDAKADLEAELTRLGKTWNNNYHYQVGYDSPWTMIRHNEIWLEVQQQQ